MEKPAHDQQFQQQFEATQQVATATREIAESLAKLQTLYAAEVAKYDEQRKQNNEDRKRWEERDKQYNEDRTLWLEWNKQWAEGQRKWEQNFSRIDPVKVALVVVVGMLATAQLLQALWR